MHTRAFSINPVPLPEEKSASSSYSNHSAILESEEQPSPRLYYFPSPQQQVFKYDSLEESLATLVEGIPAIKYNYSTFGCSECLLRLDQVKKQLYWHKQSKIKGSSSQTCITPFSLTSKHG